MVRWAGEAPADLVRATRPPGACLTCWKATTAGSELSAPPAVPPGLPAPAGSPPGGEATPPGPGPPPGTCPEEETHQTSSHSSAGAARNDWTLRGVGGQEQTSHLHQRACPVPSPSPERLSSTSSTAMTGSPTSPPDEAGDSTWGSCASGVPCTPPLLPAPSAGWDSDCAGEGVCPCAAAAAGALVDLGAGTTSAAGREVGGAVAPDSALAMLADSCARTHTRDRDRERCVRGCARARALGDDEAARPTARSAAVLSPPQACPWLPARPRAQSGPPAPAAPAGS